MACDAERIADDLEDAANEKEELKSGNTTSLLMLLVKEPHQIEEVGNEVKSKDCDGSDTESKRGHIAIDVDTRLARPWIWIGDLRLHLVAGCL